MAMPLPTNLWDSLEELLERRVEWRVVLAAWQVGWGGPCLGPSVPKEHSPLPPEHCGPHDAGAVPSPLLTGPQVPATGAGRTQTGATDSGQAQQSAGGIPQPAGPRGGPTPQPIC